MSLAEPPYFTDFKKNVTSFKKDMTDFKKDMTDFKIDTNRKFDVIQAQLFAFQTEARAEFSKLRHLSEKILGFQVENASDIKDLQDENTVGAHRVREIQDQVDRHERDISDIKRVVFPRST